MNEQKMSSPRTNSAGENLHFARTGAPARLSVWLATSLKQAEDDVKSAEENAKGQDVEGGEPGRSYKIFPVCGNSGPRKHLSVDSAPLENHLVVDQFKGFLLEEQTKLYERIDEESSKIFAIVNKITSVLKEGVEAAIKGKRGVIRLNRTNPKAFLHHLNIVKTLESPSIPCLQNTVSEDRLNILRTPLDAGWTRNVVTRASSTGGRKISYVFYYPPEGRPKLRFLNQVAQHLASVQATALTVENFCFAKVRIGKDLDREILLVANRASSSRGQGSASKHGKMTGKLGKRNDLSIQGRATSIKERLQREVLRRKKQVVRPSKQSLLKRNNQGDAKRKPISKLMQIGLLPPKYPKRLEESSSRAVPYEMISFDSEGIIELANETLFQISALRLSGRLNAEIQKLIDESMDDDDLQILDPPTIHHKQERVLIPCSIRCAGEIGRIPDVKCERCFCLYHPKCLASHKPLLVPDYATFICFNCILDCSYSLESEAKLNTPGKLQNHAGDTKINARVDLFLEQKTGVKMDDDFDQKTDVKKDVNIEQKIVVKQRHPPALLRVTGLPRVYSYSRLSSKAGVPLQTRMTGGMPKGTGMISAVLREPSISDLPNPWKPMSPDRLTVTAVRNSGIGTLNVVKPFSKGLPELNNKHVMNTQLPIPFRKDTTVRVTMPPPPTLTGYSFKKILSSAPIGRIPPPRMKLSPSLLQSRPQALSITKWCPQNFCTITNNKILVPPRHSAPDFPMNSFQILTPPKNSVMGNGLAKRITFGEAVPTRPTPNFDIMTCNDGRLIPSNAVNSGTKITSIHFGFNQKS